MKSKNHNEPDRVLEEVEKTQNYINQVSDSIHQQIWEMRRVVQEIRFIIGLLLGLVILNLVILFWKFIAATFFWLCGLILLLYKFLEPTIDLITFRGVANFIFWSLTSLMAGFLFLFVVRAAPYLLRSWWQESKVKIRIRQILGKSNTAAKQNESSDVGDQQIDPEKTAYSRRMYDYLHEAESYLDKQKEAKMKSG